MSNVKITINGLECEAPAGSTILEAARLNGIDIPTLCYLKETNKIAACRICLVEVKGMRIPAAACSTAVREGMEINTESELARQSRKMNLELIAENHRLDCEYCPNYQGCELHTLFTEYRVNTRKLGNFAKPAGYDETSLHLGRDTSRCILCRRCAAVCEKQDVRAIAVLGRGDSSRVAAPEGLGASSCIGCGQCATVCPTGSIFVKDDTHSVWVTVNQGRKPVIAVVTPEVGAALGESFHEKLGENVTGKLTAFLKSVGVKAVYPVKDGGEKRAAVDKLISEGKVALSGDCRAFVRYVEHFFPEVSGNIADAPPPEITAARLARERYARESGVKPEDITVVSISSCTSQKLTRALPEYEGVIDAAITTVELYEMLHHACLSRYTTLDVWKKLEPAAFDELGCEENGLPDAVKGDTSGEIAECEADGLRVKTVSGLGNVRAVLESVKSGTADCDYIAVRACPGGCVNGGGQPKLPGRVHNFTDYAALRGKAL